MRDKNKIMTIVTVILSIIVCALIYENMKLKKENDTLQLTQTFLSNDTPVQEEQSIMVYVSGEVVDEGIYSVKAGSRLYDAIEAAGGATLKGEIGLLDLAEQLHDGQTIVVPASNALIDKTEDVDDNKAVVTIININKANASQLQTLPGIGERLSNQILLYRELNGGFNAIEDIKKVPGIGDGLFDKIKEFITVIDRDNIYKYLD